MKYIATKIISVIMVLVLLLASFTSCGDILDEETQPSQSDPKDRDEPKDDIEITLGEEYFSIDYSLHAAESNYLKRVCLGENGEVTTIYYYNSGRIENFYYTDGKLEYSETVEKNAMSSYDETIYVGDTLLFETRYVYDGDRIVRGEVFYNGYPTQSYDEYEYTEDGALKTVKRYELGQLIETYNYNGKKRPESVQNIDRTFIPEYDESGNVIAADVNSEANRSNCYRIEIKYSDNKPYYTEKMSKGSDRYVTNVALYYFHQNGAIREISRVYSVYNEDGSFYGDPQISEVSYNEKGFAESSYEEGRLRMKLTYGDGDLLSAAEYYDNANRKTTVKIERGESGKIVKRSYYEDDGTDPVSVFEYDENGNPVRYVDNSYMSGKEVLYEYYPNGVKKKKTEIKKDITVVWTYAENGNLLTQDFGGRSFIEYVDTELCYGFKRSFSTHQFDLDATGNLIRKSTLPEGRFTEREYDENYTHIIKVIQLLEDGRRVVQVKSEDKKYVTLTEYDKDGNILHQEVNEVREYTDGFGIYGS